MEIYIESKRKKIDKLLKKYPSAEIIDVTTKGIQPWIKFSPFFPHGNIPIPFSKDIKSTSVEGVWQALKVFERNDIDLLKLDIKTMKGLKRSIKSYGKVLGHKKGINEDVLLGYLEARKFIYLPTYKWVLDNNLQEEIQKLKELLINKSIVFLDYETNEDICNLSKPLSHASLIKKYLMDIWPRFEMLSGNVS
ncbi:DUF6939 family protein [Saccharicrinis sp. 156]|uniref:DUF6939 family protein n=1 Tax=Saccharicrinis sp. 156 TaxID=3417574 RepID=UPI003D343B7D